MKYVILSLVLALSIGCKNMPHKELALSSLLNTSILKSNTIEQNETRLLDSHLFNNDIESFKALMSGKNRHYYWGKINQKFGHKILGMATSPDNWEAHNYQSKLSKQPYCRPELVNFLISKGAVPTDNNKFSFPGTAKGQVHYSSIKTGHLSGAIKSICPEVVKLLVSKLNKDIVAKATLSFSLIKMEKHANHPVIAPKIGEIAKLLGETNKANCTGNNQSCLAVAHVKNEIKNFGGREKRRRYLATKEGQIEIIFTELCNHSENKDHYLNLIKEEKAKGRVSGYVNPLKLKDWGDRAFDENKQIKTKSKVFKKMSKKSFSKRHCG